MRQGTGWSTCLAASRSKGAISCIGAKVILLIQPSRKKHIMGPDKKFKFKEFIMNSYWLGLREQILIQIWG
jgi:hypothetical protein